MEVRTFRAASLQEALQQVRESLGPDASVLHTRQVRRGPLSLFSKPIVEVEASRDVPVASRFATTGSQPKRDSQPGPRTPPPGGPSASQTQAPPQPHTASPAAFARVQASPLPGPPEFPPSPQQATPLPTYADLHRPTEIPSAVAERFVADSYRTTPAERSSPSEATPPSSMTPAMFEVLSELLDGGVAPQLARQLLTEAATMSTQPQQNDPWLVKGQICQQLAAQLKVSGTVDIADGEQQIVALVGPTGVGKTTTLAKIAAGFRFDLGCDVGLITLDTFRLGAVDQLLQYAELISAPLEVVSSPDQVTGALQRLRECDLVLLDTAGRAPGDTEQLAVLQDFLRAAEPDATHLVLSATSSTAHTRDTLAKFSVLNPTNLLITKLDEAVGFGAWLSVLRETNLPVSYLTTGQHVPQDIAVATSRRLASMLLGHSHHDARQAV